MENRVGKIFIGGSGRSGTTILRNIIGLNEKVFSFFYELNFFSLPGGLDWYLRGRINEKQLYINLFKNQIFGSTFSLKANWLDRLYMVIKEKNVFDENMTEADFHEYVEKIFVDSFTDENRYKNVSFFIRRLFDDFTIKTGKTHWLEKTPSSIRMIDKLYKMFPDFYYIHIIRDYRDVIASMRRSAWSNNKNLKILVKEYCDVMKAGFYYKQYVPDKNIFILKFEDLVNYMEDNIKKIIYFLNLEYSDDYIKKINNIFSEKRINNNRWKKDFSEDEIYFIDSECKEVYDNWIKSAR